MNNNNISTPIFSRGKEEIEPFTIINNYEMKPADFDFNVFKEECFNFDRLIAVDHAQSFRQVFSLKIVCMPELTNRIVFNLKSADFFSVVGFTYGFSSFSGSSGIDVAICRRDFKNINNKNEILPITIEAARRNIFLIPIESFCCCYKDISTTSDGNNMRIIDIKSPLLISELLLPKVHTEIFNNKIEENSPHYRNDNRKDFLIRNKDSNFRCSKAMFKELTKMPEFEFKGPNEILLPNMITNETMIYLEKIFIPKEKIEDCRLPTEVDAAENLLIALQKLSYKYINKLAQDYTINLYFETSAALDPMNNYNGVNLKSVQKIIEFAKRWSPGLILCF